MRCLWDTDITSFFLNRSNANVRARATAYRARYSRFSISLVTRYEIRRGHQASGALSRRIQFELFCNSNQVLPLPRSVMDRAAEVWAFLKNLGQLIGDNDILIAATALHRGLAVATANVAHFSRIPGLVVEDWTQP